MKKLLILFLVISISPRTTLFGQDAEFYDYGWLKMMQEGEDFKSIYERATEAYNEDEFKTSENHFKHYVRWQNFWTNRLHSSPNDIENEKFGMFYHMASANASSFNQNICTTNNPYADWEDWSFNTQPLLNGSPHILGGMGVMSCVKIDTSDANLQIMYAGSPIGGLWKTTDRGDNWFNVTDVTNSPGMGIADIDIDPFDNQHLLVATGTSWSMSPPGIGVIESFDGGETWDTTGLNSFPITSQSVTAYVDFVAFHPSDTNKYYAAAGDSLYMTSDQGVTWNNVILALPNQNEAFTEIMFHPLNPDTFYVSSSGSNAKIYRTLNAGNSFTDITSSFTSSTGLKNIRIDVAKRYPDTLFATVKFSNGTVRTYTNSNIGSTNQSNHYVSSSYFGGAAKSIFEVSQVNANIKFLGDIYFVRSTNGGTSSSPMYGAMHNDMRGSDYVEGLAAIAHDGGISISTNDGASWTFKSDGLNVQQNWAHDVDKDFTYLVSAMQDIGFYRYDIANGTWKMLGAGEGGRSMISDIDPTVGLVNAYCGGPFCNFNVSKYSNNGNTLQSKTKLSPNQWHDVALRPLLQFPNEDVYSGMEDVFVTSNYANTAWTKITDFDGTGFKGSAINDYIVDMDRNDVDTNLVIAAFSLQSWNRDEANIPCGDPGANCPQKKLLLSRDKGYNWKDITKGISSGLPIEYTNLSGVVFNPANPAEIWVSFGGYNEQYGAGYNSGIKVYYSPDTGNTWINESFNLPNFPVNDIVYQENSNNRLYVATDAGVFTKEANETVWECYNTNLPPAYIMHLDINDCGGALTASAHGRGMWKSPLASITLTGSTTWNGNRRVGSDLIIEGTLIINDTVEMAEGTKITVQPGGKLLVYGGVIRASDCANDFWEGIELVGQSSANQTLANMGFASFINGSEISGARVAIRTGKTDNNGYVNGTSGGYFYSSGLTLRNNLMDIRMHPYINVNTSNMSIIADKTLCNLTTVISDAALPNNEITSIHIQLDSVSGVEFNGLIIDNQLAQSTLSDRGTGINAYNSTISIAPYGATTPEFTALYRAIDCFTPNLSFTPTIDQANFIDNVQGVRLAGNDYAEITRSTFEVIDNSGHDCYGVYLDYCNAYTIEENDFSYTGGGSASYAVGIVINNSKDDKNEIYKNTFTSLQVGSLVHGNNQESGTNNGLVFKCNEYDENDYHIALEEVSSMFGTINPSIANQQEFTQGKKDGVGNTFEPVCAGGTEEEIFVDNGGNNINYFHFTDAITTPECRTTSKVSIHSVGLAFSAEDHCPSNFQTGGGGGPFEPGPESIGFDRGNNDFADYSLNNVKQMLVRGSDKKLVDKSINSYIKAELKKDTCSIAKIIQLLNYSDNNLSQLRKIAFLSKFGINNLNIDTASLKLDSKEKQFLGFMYDLENGNENNLENSKLDANHPYFMWTHAYFAKSQGSEIPAPLILPAKRVKFTADNQEEMDLTVYPNPADNQLIIKYKGDEIIDVRLFDLKGSLVKTLTLNGENRITLPVQDLLDGVYILKVFKNGRELGSEKISIQH